MYERSQELEDLMAEAEKKQISPGGQSALIDKIRDGHVNAIYMLADGLEGDVLAIIEEFTVINLLSISEMLKIGRETLIMLGIRELGGTSKEMFSRFWEWAVRQAILKEMCDQNRYNMWEMVWSEGNTFEEDEILISIIENWGI